MVYSPLSPPSLALLSCSSAEPSVQTCPCSCWGPELWKGTGAREGDRIDFPSCTLGCPSTLALLKIGHLGSPSFMCLSPSILLCPVTGPHGWKRELLCNMDLFHQCGPFPSLSLALLSPSPSLFSSQGSPPLFPSPPAFLPPFPIPSSPPCPPTSLPCSR